MSEYYDAGTYRVGNVTVKVRRPVLSDMEKARRERETSATLAHIMRDFYTRVEKEAQQQNEPNRMENHG